MCVCTVVHTANPGLVLHLAVRFATATATVVHVPQVHMVHIMCTHIHVCTLLYMYRYIQVLQLCTCTATVVHRYHRYTWYISCTHIHVLLYTGILFWRCFNNTVVYIHVYMYVILYNFR